MKGKDLFEEMGANGRLKLKYSIIYRKSESGMVSAGSWYGIAPVFHKKWQWTIVFYRGGMEGVATAPSEETLPCMQLVS